MTTNNELYSVTAIHCDSETGPYPSSFRREGLTLGEARVLARKIDTMLDEDGNKVWCAVFIRNSEYHIVYFAGPLKKGQLYLSY